MKIGGFQPCTLSDYPGHVACIVFTQGCNFCCPFCHNGGLIPNSSGNLLDAAEVLETIRLRNHSLDGVVITGGEPTLQNDLADFLKTIKTFGLKVKLDTNGGRPEVVKKLIADGLVDFIAMDIKAPLEKYHILSGVPVDTHTILKSIALIAQSGVEHLFRTTVVTQLLSDDDMNAIKNLVPNGSTYVLQQFDPTHALVPMHEMCPLV